MSSLCSTVLPGEFINHDTDSNTNKTTNVDVTDAATGIVRFTDINTHSTSFVADLGATPTKQYTYEITASDGVNVSTIALATIFGKSTVY